MQEEEKYAELLQKLSANWVPLNDKPDETPELTLRALWFFASGDPRTIIRVRNEKLPELQESSLFQLEDLVNKRISGVPLAYLIGRQEFSGLEFLANSQAMIPRKETEILAKTALEKLKLMERSRREENLKIMDLCTGSGVIALTIAHHMKKCECFGADISEEAVELAQNNARTLGLENRTRFFSGDLYSPFKSEEFYKCMDMITCNPPYISSSQMELMPQEIIAHEPWAAFDGGAFGVNILMRVTRQAPEFLKPDSWLCFEVGLGQGNRLLNMLKKISGYAEIETFNDENGNIRVVAAHFL